MAGFFCWADSNFNTIQTLGIIGSLSLGIAAARLEAKAKEAKNLLTISWHRRELWKEAYEPKDLSRILLKDAVSTEPVCVAETEFLNLAIAHFHGFIGLDDDPVTGFRLHQVEFLPWG
jgi:hypothetical protein